MINLTPDSPRERLRSTYLAQNFELRQAQVDYQNEFTYDLYVGNPLQNADQASTLVFCPPVDSSYWFRLAKNWEDEYPPIIKEEYFETLYRGSMPPIFLDQSLHGTYLLHYRYVWLDGQFKPLYWSPAFLAALIKQFNIKYLALLDPFHEKDFNYIPENLYPKILPFIAETIKYLNKELKVQVYQLDSEYYPLNDFHPNNLKRPVIGF